LGEKGLLGRFFGVGVGPGDPELITLKALKVLTTVDVICAPKANAKRSSLALRVVRRAIQLPNEGQELVELVYPMVRDSKLREMALEKNVEIIVSRLRDRKDVAFITLGDPLFYSTFIYTYRKVLEKLPNVYVEVIPGVTSISACAAASRTPIAEAEDVIVIVPATSNLERLESLANQADTVILLKGIKNAKGLCEALKGGGFKEDSRVVVVRNVGGPSEEVKVMRLHDLQELTERSYLSTVIVRRC
jgi:precorrin-2/cobalt-factor-2 C20-methyltransferase